MPYHRELKDGKKVLVSKMLLLTRQDAVYAANMLNAYGDFKYVAAPRFLGYEGADYGVNKYHHFDWHNDNSNQYAGYVDERLLLQICSDRPIVHQSKSFE